MKKAAFMTKVILFPLILLAGIAVTVYFCRQSLRFPHLHLALSEISLKTVCYLAGLLLAAAFAVVAAEYLLFNLKDAFWKLLIPAFAFLVLLAGCVICFRCALRPLAYSYTDSPSDCEADFDPSRFQTPEGQLFPDPVTGTVTGYRLYRDGPLEAEIVTVTYELAPYYTEARRIQRMGLSGFEMGEERTCYELPLEDCLYQIDVNNETHQIFYRRFVQPEALPSYAPQPETEPEEPDTMPGLVTDFESYFDARRFQVGATALYEHPTTGQVTDYLLYRNGDTAAEQVTVSFTLAAFYSEQARINRLRLTAFRLDENRVCYELQVEGCQYQLVVDAQNNRILYKRFVRAEGLPYYAPHPTVKPAESPTEPETESDIESEEPLPSEPGQPLPSIPVMH